VTIVGEAVVVIRGKDMLSADLGNALKPALQSVGNAASTIGQTIRSKIGAGIQAIATTTAAVTGAVATATAGIVAQGVSYNVLMQKSRAAFTTVLGSAAAADKMLNSIQRFASTSPFPRQVFIEATQQMLGFGFAAEDVIPTLGAVQDAVAATGGSSEDITSIVNALSQVQASGKFTGDALMQLSGKGINAAEIIGKQMGKTGAQIKDEISKGALGADEGITALTKGMSEKFGGAAANLKGTWVGATDSIKGATRDLGSALVAPFIDPKGGGYAVDWAGLLATKIRDATKVIVPMFTGMIDKIRPTFDAISKAMEGVDIGKVFGSIADTVKDLAPLLAPIAAALVTMGGANIAGMLGPLGALLGPLANINPIFAAIVALIAVMPELQDAFKEIIPIVMDAAKQIMDAFGPAISGLMPFIHELAGVVADILVQAFTDLLPPIMDLITGLMPLVPVIMELADIFITGLVPVISIVISLIGDLLSWLGDIPGIMPGIVGAIIALNLAMSANPVALVIIGIVLLIGLLIKLWPQISQGVDKMKEFGASIGEHLGKAWDKVKEAFSSFLDFFTGLWDSLIGIVRGNWPVLLAVFAPMIGIPILIIRNWDKISGFFGKVIGNIVSVVREGIPKVVNFFRAMPSRIGASIGNIWGFMRGKFSDLFRSARSAVISFLTNYIAFWRNLPGRMSNALGNIWSRLSARFTSVFRTMREHVSNGLQVVVGFFRNLPSRLASALGNIWNDMAGKFNALFSAIRGKVRSGVDSAADAMSALPGRLAGALGSISSTVGAKVASELSGLRSKVTGAISGAGSWLVSAGRAIISGLISGIGQMASAVASRARSVVAGAVSAAKSALKIHSPSAVFQEIGVSTIEGMNIGLEKAAPGLNATMSRIMGGVARHQPSIHAALGLSGGRGLAGGGGARVINLFPDATIVMSGTGDADAIIKRIETLVAGSRL
jgi:tape measure domain-containing protein